MIKTLIISYTDDATKPIMIVGTKTPNMYAEPINHISGQEATDIFNRLTTKKEK